MKTNTRIGMGVLTAAGAFLLAFLWFSFLYLADNKYTAGPPYGKEGVFSFSEQDLHSDRLLFLIDGWELYPDALLSPDEIASESPTPRYVFIGQYPNFSFFTPGHSPFGMATYRMNLRYDGTPTILLLEIPEIFTDSRLWIAGEEVSLENSSVAFQAKGETELVLQTKNDRHYYSGLTYPPALGTAKAVQRMFFFRNLFYGALCLIPLTLCLYAAASWLAREKNSRLLHFGLLCLFFSVHCAHPFLHQLNLTGPLWYAVEDAAWMGVLYECIALATNEAGLSGKRWYLFGVRPAAIASCILCACSILFILPQLEQGIKLYGGVLDGYKGLCFFYLLVCAVFGVLKQGGRACLILAGCGVLGASLWINMLDNSRFEPVYTGWQTEYAGFFLVLAFWVLTALHSADMLRQNRLLTQRLEEEVQSRTAELRGVLEERKAFFSDLVHNLKAPMAAIHGFTGMIRRGNLYLDAELSGYFDKISGANQELSRRIGVLGDLNAFDRIQGPPERLDVDELLAQVYADNGPEAEISGIVLRVEKLSRPAFVIAQKEKLLLLFENLIYNAFSFTPEDGSIVITPKLWEGTVVITVADTGSGIEPEKLPHIFERFYVGRANQQEGNGLGLYIVQLITRELSGSIQADSVVGKGTVFTIRLPVVE